MVGSGESEAVAHGAPHGFAIEIIKMIPFTERTPPGVSMAGLMPPSSPGVSISVKRDMMPGVIRQLLVATATVVGVGASGTKPDSSLMLLARC